MLKTDISKKRRISAAIYLVTSFFDDKEPLKWGLRLLSIDLISEKVKDKSDTVLEILSLFSIAKTAGMISEMNHDILTRELSQFDYEVKKPLESIFSSESMPNERILSEPRRTESLKDKINEKPLLKEFGAVSVKKNNRQNIIITILKRKREIMIKDISSLINDCSEKTIQRELLAMVHAGLLKKVGEKRWSRYSLA